MRAQSSLLFRETYANFWHLSFPHTSRSSLYPVIHTALAGDVSWTLRFPERSSAKTYEKYGKKNMKITTVQLEREIARLDSLNSDFTNEKMKGVN